MLSTPIAISNLHKPTAHKNQTVNRLVGGRAVSGTQKSAYFAAESARRLHIKQIQSLRDGCGDLRLQPNVPIEHL